MSLFSLGPVGDLLSMEQVGVLRLTYQLAANRNTSYESAFNISSILVASFLLFFFF